MRGPNLDSVHTYTYRFSWIPSLLFCGLEVPRNFLSRLCGKFSMRNDWKRSENEDFRKRCSWSGDFSTPRFIVYAWTAKTDNSGERFCPHETIENVDKTTLDKTPQISVFNRLPVDTTNEWKRVRRNGNKFCKPLIKNLYVNKNELKWKRVFKKLWCEIKTIENGYLWTEPQVTMLNASTSSRLNNIVFNMKEF